MLKLVYANISRLMKNRAFHIAAAAAAVLSLVEIFTAYMDYANGTGSEYFESGFAGISALGLFMVAAVVSLFTGTEFAEGTIRNKIVTGHSRLQIYLANLITSVLAGGLILTVWVVLYVSIGYLMMESGNPFFVYVLSWLRMLGEFAALCAVCTMITTTIVNKAGSAVVCILTTLIFVMGGIVINSILMEPEYYPPSITITSDGAVTEVGETVPNPNYLPAGSTKRKVYEFLQDFTTGGQAVQMAGAFDGRVSVFVMYDALIVMTVSAAGYLIFSRRDLK